MYGSRVGGVGTGCCQLYAGYGKRTEKDVDVCASHSRGALVHAEELMFEAVHFRLEVGHFGGDV